MKLLVLYRQNSEHGRKVDEFMHDLQRQHGLSERRFTVYDIDTREGAAMASLYDIVSYPAFTIVGDDGRFIKGWQGSDFPLMDEVMSYTFSY